MSNIASQVPLAPRKAEEDVWKYPRPPALERVPNRLRVVWYDLEGKETVIADTTDAFRVLETSHPPTYYLPPSSLQRSLTKTSRHTFCEWKGNASYHSYQPPSSSAPISNRVWSYESPTPGFTPIKDYVSFYASTGVDKTRAGGEWRCFVDDERVGVQEGDFYGGWITSNIKGKMKGGPGTWGW
ncbi:hypothetical protein P7C73_g1731, partial [Tremellales sp. Uapishka_1]